VTEHEKCQSCKGRGWHIGECHPREACGACVGTGYEHPELAVGDLKAEVTRLTAELATAKAELARLKGRRFPIMGAGFSIPWAMIAPFEQQARSNHDQSLERLAERGGLDPVEAIAVLDGKKLRAQLTGYDPTAARGELLKRMTQYDAAGGKRT